MLRIPSVFIQATGNSEICCANRLRPLEQPRGKLQFLPSADRDAHICRHNGSRIEASVKPMSTILPWYTWGLRSVLNWSPMMPRGTIESTIRSVFLIAVGIPKVGPLADGRLEKFGKRAYQARPWVVVIVDNFPRKIVFVAFNLNRFAFSSKPVRILRLGYRHIYIEANEVLISSHVWVALTTFKQLKYIFMTILRLAATFKIMNPTGPTRINRNAL